MCHAPDSRPPPPPIAGGAGIAGTDELVLVASDGTRFLAYGARAVDPGTPGIVVMPDVRGLHPFYRDLAERFAEVGVHAVAIDYFGRTAGTAPRDYETFEFRPHANETQPDTVAMDVAAAVDHLRSQAGGRAAKLFSVGFCMGGRQSLNQAARRSDLDGGSGSTGGRRPMIATTRTRR